MTFQKFNMGLRLAAGILAYMNSKYTSAKKCNIDFTPETISGRDNLTMGSEPFYDSGLTRADHIVLKKSGERHH